MAALKRSWAWPPWAAVAAVAAVAVRRGGRFVGGVTYCVLCIYIQSCKRCEDVLQTMHESSPTLHWRLFDCLARLVPSEVKGGLEGAWDLMNMDSFAYSSN